MINFGAALGEEPRPIEPEVVEYDEPAEVMTSTMDAESVRRALARYDHDIAEMENQARQAVITDAATKEGVVKMTGRAKKLDKAIEGLRKAAVEPFNEHVKRVNGLCKGYQKRFQDITQGLTDKITIYDRAEAATRREAERIAQGAARKIEAEARKAAEAAGVPAEEVPTVSVVLPTAPTVTRTEEGSSHSRAVWKWKIVDVDALPRDWMIPDEKAINGAVRAGLRSIPGIRIYEETQTIIRT